MRICHLSKICKHSFRSAVGSVQARGVWLAGGVQISLEREGVLWRRGILAMPLIVRQSVALLRSVLDRLAAVELMLLQKPIVSGRYSGTRPSLSFTAAHSARLPRVPDSRGGYCASIHPEIMPLRLWLRRNICEGYLQMLFAAL